jgi:glycosyltransferase involved in cell wall biosynthesis
MPRARTNITFLTSCVEIGGAETALSHLLLGLHRERFFPRLVCLRAKPGQVATQLQSEGIPLLSGFSRGRFDPFVAHRLIKTLRSGTDILYCLAHHNVLFWLPYVLRRIKVKACVLICQQTKDLNSGSAFSLTDRPALRYVQRIVAVAHQQKQYLVDHEGLPSERIEVIHNSVSPAEFIRVSSQNFTREAVRRQWNLTEEHRVAMIVANLRPEKNHARFLRIARAVAGWMPQARFVVVGDGTERARLERLAQSFGIADVVHFAGARRDIPAVLVAADVVTLTSDIEAFPLALLEAMAAARPIVATRVGSLEEMVIEGNTGHLIRMDDENAFADSLHRLLSDRVRGQSMGDAGRQHVLQNFTAEKMVQAHERLFESLMQEALLRSRPQHSSQHY